MNIIDHGTRRGDFSPGAILRFSPTALLLLVLLLATLSSLTTACSRNEAKLDSRQQAAANYIRAVLKNNRSHQKLELNGLPSHLRRYAYLGNELEWKKLKGPIRFLKFEGISKGPGRAQNLGDYLYGLTGDGPYTTGGNGVTEIVNVLIADREGTEHWAMVALRPQHGTDPKTEGRFFDWSKLRWGIVPPPEAS